MVDETLKRLLDAEAKAEQVVARADEERQAIIEQARQEAHTTEVHHDKRVAEIHAAFHAQAEQRAQQSVAELQRRYAEHILALRASAKRQEQQAIEDALALLTGSGKS